MIPAASLIVIKQLFEAIATIAARVLADAFSLITCGGGWPGWRYSYRVVVRRTTGDCPTGRTAVDGFNSDSGYRPVDTRRRGSNLDASSDRNTQ
jgi:hypothetical protein